MTSHTPAKFGGHRHRGSGDIMVLICNLSCNLVRPRDSRVMRLYGWDLLMVSHTPV